MGISENFVERLFNNAPEIVFYIEAEDNSRTKPVSLTGRRPTVDFCLKSFIPTWDIRFALESFNTTAYSSGRLNEGLANAYMRESDEGEIKFEEDDYFKPDSILSTLTASNFTMSGTINMALRCLMYRPFENPPLEEDVATFRKRLPRFFIHDFEDIESIEAKEYLVGLFNSLCSSRVDAGMQFSIFDAFTYKEDNPPLYVSNDNNATFYSYRPIKCAITEMDSDPDNSVVTFMMSLAFAKYSPRNMFSVSQFV